MSQLQIGRLTIGAPIQWFEQTGDPVQALGGAVVPNQRTAPQFQLTIGTIAADGATDTQAARLVLRRKLRSMLNNTPLKLQGFLYLVYSDDSEQDGWYVPDQGSLQDFQGSSGLATGFWQMQANWFLVGHQRTHREARQVWMKDLRTGLYQRDTLGWIYSTDFSALPGLQLSMLPSGATSLLASWTQAGVSTSLLPTGRDGGSCLVASGISDLVVVSYERPESSLNLGDVIVYDRMGQITAPSTGPDTSWVEFYGADWPYNWQTVGQPNDTPVLDNGLVRVRYDASVGVPGLRVDVWNGSAYVEQGKAYFVRYGDSTSTLDTYVTASLREWTPERAVMMLTLSSSADNYSRERIFVTVQRGELGCTVEYYPAAKSTGAAGDGAVFWAAPPGDTNASVIGVNSQTQPPPAGTGVIKASAGTGSASLPSATVAGSFTGWENYLAFLRYSAVATITPYQATIVVLQAAVGGYTVPGDLNAYGSSTNAVEIKGTGGLGYCQAQVAFSATQAQQVLEAESMTLGTGTSSTADASASNGFAATATRTTDANAHTTQATWPNSFAGQFRVFLRVKVSAGTGSFYVKTGATTGSTVTTTSTSYVWVDCGEITANASTMEIHAWTSSGTVYVDRMEAVLTQDRTRSSAIYSGSRDLGQAALYDARQLGAIVARQ